MKSMLRIECTRAFRNKSFWVVMAFGAVLALWHFLQVVIPTSHYIIPHYARGDIGYPASVFYVWMPYRVECFATVLLFYLLPLMATLPFASSYYTDRKTGYLKNILTRTKRKNYFCSKYLAVFLSGGTTVAFPLLFNLALTALLIPSVRPRVGVGSFILGQHVLWSELFSSHPYLYCFLYVAVDFVAAGLLAVLAVALSDLIGNRFAILLAPLLIYLFANYLCMWMNQYGCSPMNFLSPMQGGGTINSAALFLSLFGLLAVALGSLLWKLHRYEVY